MAAIKQSVPDTKGTPSKCYLMHCQQNSVENPGVFLVLLVKVSQQKRWKG